MPLQSCITGSITAYNSTSENEWSTEHVAHLYQRLGFGATYQELKDGYDMGADALVNMLIDEVSTFNNPYFNWANGYGEDNALANDQRKELQRLWLTQMLEQNFRTKLALFWHNHFVTQFATYRCAPYLYRYYRFLMDNGMGNFREMVREIGTTEAMLVFLNGSSNVKSNPNENYARELFELFTIGQGNGYTETDIEEAARALTGYYVNRYDCDVAVFRPENHDEEPKTIFGVTANFDYNGLIDHLFDVRANEIAQYICTKIYRFFVYDVVNPNIVDAMVQTFIDNDFELEPMFRQLFKSEHFFDVNARGIRIKSPLEAFLIAIRKLNINYNDDDYIDKIGSACRELDQYLFDPPDVSGWKEHRAWITEETLTKRWERVGRLLLNNNDLPYGSLDNMVDVLRDIAQDLENPDDMNAVARAFIDFVLGKSLIGDNDYDGGIIAFQSSVPMNYFTGESTETWTIYYAKLDEQLTNLLDYIIRLPEFQLC